MPPLSEDLLTSNDLTAPRFVDRTDWEVLNSMPEDSRFRLDPATREPVAAGLIDNNDVVLYFDL